MPQGTRRSPELCRCCKRDLDLPADEQKGEDRCESETQRLQSPSCPLSAILKTSLASICSRPIWDRRGSVFCLSGGDAYSFRSTFLTSHLGDALPAGIQLTVLTHVAPLMEGQVASKDRDWNRRLVLVGAQWGGLSLNLTQEKTLPE